MGTLGAAASARCAGAPTRFYLLSLKPADREIMSAVYALITSLYMQLKFARSTGPLYPHLLLSTLSCKTILACDLAAAPPLGGHDGRLQQAIRPVRDVLLPRARGVQACAR